MSWPKVLHYISLWILIFIFFALYIFSFRFLRKKRVEAENSEVRKKVTDTFGALLHDTLTWWWLRWSSISTHWLFFLNLTTIRQKENYMSLWADRHSRCTSGLAWLVLGATACARRCDENLYWPTETLEVRDFCQKLLLAEVGGKGIALGQKGWHLCRLQCSEGQAAPCPCSPVDFNMKGVL